MGSGIWPCIAEMIRSIQDFRATLAVRFELMRISNITRDVILKFRSEAQDLTVMQADLNVVIASGP